MSQVHAEQKIGTGYMMMSDLGIPPLRVTAPMNGLGRANRVSNMNGFDAGGMPVSAAQHKSVWKRE
jgi:hypothetical protein